jgi:hypothetical protein
MLMWIKEEKFNHFCVEYRISSLHKKKLNHFSLLLCVPIWIANSIIKQLNNKVDIYIITSTITELSLTIITIQLPLPITITIIQLHHYKTRHCLITSYHYPISPYMLPNFTLLVNIKCLNQTTRCEFLNHNEH